MFSKKKNKKQKKLAASCEFILPVRASFPNRQKGDLFLSMYSIKYFKLLEILLVFVFCYVLC